MHLVSTKWIENCSSFRFFLLKRTSKSSHGHEDLSHRIEWFCDIGFSRAATQLLTSQLVPMPGIILLPLHKSLHFLRPLWTFFLEYEGSFRVKFCNFLSVSLIPTKVYSHCTRSYCPGVWWLYWMIRTLVSLEYFSCCWLPAGYWVIDYCPLSPTIQPIFGSPKSPFVQTIFLQLAVENAVGESVRGFTKN